MVAIPFIAPYFPVESPSFHFSHSYIFKINRLYDILENELNQSKLLSGLTGELNIAVTYLLIKERARVCQSAPCMFYFSKVSQILKMYKFSFFSIFYIYAFSEKFQLYLCRYTGFTFLFVCQGGLGSTPTSGISVHCIHTLNTNPLLAQCENVKTGQIHFSRTWTKIKGFKIENIFLYKIQAQKNSLSMYMIWIGCIII